MSRLYRLLLGAAFGYALGLAVGRPGFGLTIGLVVSFLTPIGRILRSSVATFFLALFVVILVFPPLAAVFGLFMVVPLLLAWNLFSPGGSESREDRWFTFFGGSNPNKLMVELMAGLVQVSEDSAEERTQTIRNFIMRNNPGVSSQFLWEHYKQAMDESVDAGEVGRDLAEAASNTQQAFCLQVLVEIATIDGELTDDQEEYIREVARAFQLSETEVEAVLSGSRSRAGSRRQGTRGNRRRGGRRRGRRGSRGRGGSARNGSLRDAYETLDLDPSASRSEVKEAYQEKVKKHHPDRHRNGNEQSVEEAEERMAEINQAYQRIKEQW